MSPWRFLTTWCRTRDEHDRVTPVKLYPNKEYLYIITEYWKHYPMLLVPKSRQLLATWTIAALYLWDSMFFTHGRTFFQSKKEDDSEENVARAFFIWENLPEFMKEWCPADKTFCRIQFKNKSVIVGIPAGAEHYRQFTSRGIFSDEMVYQTEVENVMAAVAPSLLGGGRFTGVSSMGPSYFSQMIFDEI